MKTSESVLAGNVKIIIMQYWRLDGALAHRMLRKSIMHGAMQASTDRWRTKILVSHCEMSNLKLPYADFASRHQRHASIDSLQRLQFAAGAASWDCFGAFTQ
jgi:hypothetical protein